MGLPAAVLSQPSSQTVEPSTSLTFSAVQGIEMPIGQPTKSHSEGAMTLQTLPYGATISMCS